jgi:hypothetical protein
MRLPETKIKEAILHPEKLVRQEALNYFADCFSRDPDVMPLAIKALETFGRRDAFQYVHVLSHLAQTEATLAWAVKELYRDVQPTAEYDGYLPALSRLLCEADPQLLLPRAEEILQAPGFDAELAETFQDNLGLAAWDADQCWAELERFCAEAIGEEDWSELDFDHASRVVKALARQGAKFVDRTLELLGREVGDFETDPMSCMEIHLVELAGEMRLERAVPLIVKKLHERGDNVEEECVDALGKIGTGDAAEAVTEGWPETSWEYRLYAAGALEKIHTDMTVRKCLELLPVEKDVGIKTNLATALLGQMAEEAIEPVRQMVLQRDYDSEGFDVPGRLVTVSTILGVTFPEYAEWKRESEERWAETERRMQEVRESWKNPPPPAPAWEPPPLAERKQAPFVRADKPVGRNDPCPCGSGKKFKNCCLKRDRD